MAPSVKAPPWGLHRAFEVWAPVLPQGGLGPPIVYGGREIQPFVGLLEVRAKQEAEERARAARLKAAEGQPTRPSQAASCAEEGGSAEDGEAQAARKAEAGDEERRVRG